MSSASSYPLARPELASGMAPPIRPGDLAVVVGAGASGAAAARLLHTLGADVRLVDKDSAGVPVDLRAELEAAGMEILCGAHVPEQFAGASLVVASPGVPLSLLESFLREAGNPPLIAEVELALRYVREPILAVTGTSGKTTTVSLAAAMLEAAGKKVFLGGNIGTPLSEYVLGAAKDPGNRADVLVLEMSSFQLQGSGHLHPKAAVILNLSPNHLDHHRDMAEYSAAKFRIFALQDETDLALLPESLMEEYQNRGFKGRPLTFGPNKRFSRSRLLGRHNAANIEAAWLACREFGVSESEAAGAVAAFSPLPHRLEPIREVDGVLYVNDTKSTTVDSMRAALESFEAPILLLAGGKFKGGDLHSLHRLLRDKVKAVALFGASREIFERAWQGAAPMTWDPDLPSAVIRLRAVAEPGDVVLLSPATSSFDLYENYKARGEHFRCLVQELRETAGADA
jgi:UDP-N-acetylmuramoylalanine--D-glutamate ligase